MRRRDFLHRIFATAAACGLHPRQLVAPALVPLVDRAVVRGWFLHETVSVSLMNPKRPAVIQRILDDTTATAVTLRLRTEDGIVLWERDYAEC